MFYNTKLYIFDQRELYIATVKPRFNVVNFKTNIMRKKFLEKLDESTVIWWSILLIAIAMVISFASVGQTRSEVYDYLKKIDCKFPEIVTAQAVLETGHFKSYSCRERHNLFGIRYKHEFLEFETWEESCKAYMSKIQYKYTGGDYYKFLVELGYAPYDPEYTNKLKSIKVY